MCGAKMITRASHCQIRTVSGPTAIPCLVNSFLTQHQAVIIKSTQGNAGFSFSPFLIYSSELLAPLWTDTSLNGTTLDGGHFFINDTALKATPTLTHSSFISTKTIQLSKEGQTEMWSYEWSKPLYPRPCTKHLSWLGGKKFSNLGHSVHHLLSPSTFKAKNTVKIQSLCQIKVITHFILKLDM